MPQKYFKTIFSYVKKTKIIKLLQSIIYYGSNKTKFQHNIIYYIKSKI